MNGPTLIETEFLRQWRYQTEFGNELKLSYQTEFGNELNKLKSGGADPLRAVNCVTPNKVEDK